MTSAMLQMQPVYGIWCQTVLTQGCLACIVVDVVLTGVVTIWLPGFKTIELIAQTSLSVCRFGNNLRNNRQTNWAAGEAIVFTSSTANHIGSVGITAEWLTGVQTRGDSSGCLAWKEHPLPKKARKVCQSGVYSSGFKCYMSSEES